MPSIRFNLNGRAQAIPSRPDQPLLWLLRDGLRLTGTKYGCGAGTCGACTVLVNGEPVRSCQVAAEAVEGMEVLTVEGLAKAAPVLQRAWLEAGMAPCGTCQPAMLLVSAALLQKSPHPSDREIDRALAAVSCRCANHPRIRRAIHWAAEQAQA